MRAAPVDCHVSHAVHDMITHFSFIHKLCFCLFCQGLDGEQGSQGSPGERGRMVCGCVYI